MKCALIEITESSPIILQYMTILLYTFLKMCSYNMEGKMYSPLLLLGVFWAQGEHLLYLWCAHKRSNILHNYNKYHCKYKRLYETSTGKRCKRYTNSCHSTEISLDLLYFHVTTEQSIMDMEEVRKII